MSLTILSEADLKQAEADGALLRRLPSCPYPDTERQASIAWSRGVHHAHQVVDAVVEKAKRSAVSVWDLKTLDALKADLDAALRTVEG